MWSHLKVIHKTLFAVHDRMIVMTEMQAEWEGKNIYWVCTKVNIHIFLLLLSSKSKQENENKQLTIQHHFNYFQLHILFSCFLTRKYPFLDQPGPGITPGWCIKVSNISFPIAWGVLWHINQFPGWFFIQYGTLSFWLFFDLFLDPPGPGITPGWGLNDLNPPWHMYKEVPGPFRV